MTQRSAIAPKQFCCSSWRTMCFWGCAFAVFYAAGLAAIYWLHLPKYGLAALFAALGLACVANFARNRTFHCVITAPFFLLVALVFALNASGIWRISPSLVWIVAGIVTCAAFMLERRLAS